MKKYAFPYVPVILGFLLGIQPVLPSGLYLSNTELAAAVTPQTLEFVISNTLGSTNAGVNWIQITKPSVISTNVGAITTNVKVRTYYDGVTLTTLTSVPWSSTWGWTDTEVMVTNSGDDLFLYLGNAVTNNTVPARNHVWVSWNLVASNSFSSENFTGAVDAVQWNSMATTKKGLSSTTGPQRYSTSANVTRTMANSEAFASIIPNSMNQNAGPYTFTVYIQNKSNLNYRDIKYAAIKIPPEFTSANSFTNFDSVALGTNEAQYIRITNNLPGLGATSNYIFIDYTSVPIARSGLDVISFKYTGNPVVGTNDTWDIRVDGVAIDNNSYISITNASYPDNRVTVGAASVNETWDMQVVRAKSVSPTVIGVSNTYAMAYVDLIADGDTRGTETLTSMSVSIEGMSPEISGNLKLFYTNNAGNFSTNSTLLGTVALVPGAGNSNYTFNFSQTGQSQSAANPDRYWFALTLTNGVLNAFSNRVRVVPRGIATTGPDSTNDGLAYFTAMPDYPPSRIDSLRVAVDASTMTNPAVISRYKQGSFDNYAFRLTVNNDDPDATNFLMGLTVSNLGTANNNDLGFFKLFRDSDANGLLTGADEIVLSGAMNTNAKSYNLVASLANAIGGVGTTTYFGTYDVKYSSTIGKTIDLKAVLGTNLVWQDFYDTVDFTASQADSRPTNISSANVLPSTNAIATITPAAAQDYDFLVTGVSYTMAPVNFSTNQFAPLVRFSLNQDVEQTNGTNYHFAVITNGATTNAVVTNQVFQGIRGMLTSTTTYQDVRGFAILYRDSDGDGIWSNTDAALGSNTVTGNGAVDITGLSISNVPVYGVQAAQNYFVVLRLTNLVSSIFTNNFSLKITNLVTAGPDNGVLGSLNLFTNVSSVSSSVRVDDGRVDILFVSNYFASPNAVQTTVKNRFLQFALAGSDPDAVYSWSYLDIKTNGKSDIVPSADQVNQVAVENANGDFLGIGKITNNGAVRITFFSPETLSGTATNIYYLSYNVAVYAPVGGKIGFTVPANAWGFSDTSLDGFAQASFAAGNMTGPAIETNTVVQALGYVPWDFLVMNSQGIAPSALGASNIVPMSFADVQADTESPILQKISNAMVEVVGGPEVSGLLYIYRDTNNSSSFSTNSDWLIGQTNFAGGGSYPIRFTMPMSNLFTSASLPDPYTRFWCALMVTNGVANLWTNKVGARISGMSGDYQGSFAVFTNSSVFTNYALSTARIDSLLANVAVPTNYDGDASQGSFNNLAFPLFLTNSDPDGTNYLSGITVSNQGNTPHNQLGFFRIYLDNGDSNFDPSSDTLVMLANGNSSNQWLMTANPPVALRPGETRLWGAFDVTLGATVNNTVKFVIPTAASIQFSDGIADTAYASVDQTARLVGSGPFPSGTVLSKVIASFVAKPFDLNITAGTSRTPVAVTTNQRVVFGEYRIYKDLDANPIILTNAVVQTLSSGSANNVFGTISLVADTNGNGALDNGDLILGTAPWNAGGNVAVPMNWSNMTLNTTDPDRVFLVATITNDIASVKNDRFRLWLSDLSGVGSDGGGGAAGFTNLQNLTNSSPVFDSKVDDFRVQVLWVSNAMATFTPKQYDQNNVYLHVRLAGSDPDATNYLRALDVNTNGTTSNFTSDLVAFLKTATVINSFNGKLLAVNGVEPFTLGASRITFTTPMMVPGTNAVDFWIGYDAGITTNVYLKSMGLKITNAASFVFQDNTNDSVDQTGFVDPAFLGGPSNATNVVFYGYNSQPWDIEVTAMSKDAPPRATVGLEWPIFSVDCYRDIENGAETLTGFHLAGLPSGGRAYSGVVSVYYDYSASGFTNFAAGQCLLSNIPLSSINPGVALNVGNPSIAALPGFSRFMITFKATNFDPLADVTFQVTNWTASGPNGGTFSTPSVWFLTNRARVLMDDVTLTAQVSDLVTGGLKQGDSGFPLLKIQLTPVDADASLTLERFTFTSTDTENQDRFLSARLYKESGNAPGYDAQDTALSGSVTFTAGTARVVLNNNLTIPSSGVTLYLVAGADAGAKVNNSVRVTFPRSSQGDAFTPLNVVGNSVSPTLTTYATETTSSFTIIRSIDFGDDTVKGASTVLNPCDGPFFKVYFKDLGDAATANVTVFDGLGSFVRKLSVPSGGDSADWNGRRADGTYAASGIYTVVVETTKNGTKSEKRYRVMLRKCQ